MKKRKIERNMHCSGMHISFFKVVWTLSLALHFLLFNFWTSQEEQECILKSKEESGEDKGLNWEDAKKMPITSRVIQETLRVASILSFTFREAVEDVEYQGQLPNLI